MSSPSRQRHQQWLQQQVKWGLLHCPDIKTVKRHMDNWAALQKCPAALDLIEAAVNRWVRDNLLVNQLSETIENQLIMMDG